MAALKKGDHVRVTSHEFDTTPSGQVNDTHGYGTTGVIDHFRNGKATVELDASPGFYADWPRTMIESVTR